MGLVTLTYDLLMLKLVCESHLGWETFFSKFGLCILELFAVYATDGQTD